MLSKIYLIFAALGLESEQKLEALSEFFFHFLVKNMDIV